MQEVIDEIPEKETKNEPVIKKFNTFQEAKMYYNNELKNKYNSRNICFTGRGPNDRKKDNNGFYPSTAGKGLNKTKVRATNEIHDIRKWALNDKHLYTFYPCYTDITDKNTLEWWMIHH